MMDKIGNYTLLQELGKGGMGQVYLAHDPRFDRGVAIKVLPREFLHDDKFLARFEREARTIALLEHPAIVPVYDYGEEDGQPYLVMRYMAGGTLRDRMTQGEISNAEILKIIAPIAEALNEAHKNGIVHRDMKPGNILFDSSGRAYLSDFGIAKISQAQTLTGSALVGTPAYMSPELVHGDQILDGRSDVYSLGIILYEMLAGEKPYQADTPGKVLMKHVLDPVPDIHKHRADLPAELKAITDKALAKDRDDRYSTAIELSAALASAMQADFEIHMPERNNFPGNNSDTINHLKTPIWTDPLTRDLLMMEPTPTPAPKVNPRKKISWRWLTVGAGILLLSLTIYFVFMAWNALFLPATAEIAPTPTAIATATAAVEAPLAPTKVSDAYGHEMTLVNAGEFIMGNDSGEPDEGPAHNVFLDDYYVDLYEVTNEQYAIFLNANGNQGESGLNWLSADGPDVHISQSAGDWHAISGYETHPVTYVSWFGAQAYCEWRGGSLPSEAQWEKAARGLDGRTYPWGEGIDSELANYNQNNNETMPVGSYPDGISPYGLYDMAGNVREWVLDWYGSGYYESSPHENPTGAASGATRVLRGGAWVYSDTFLRTTDRYYDLSGYVGNNIGFRCVNDTIEP